MEANKFVLSECCYRHFVCPGVVDIPEFYNDAVNEPDFNIKDDYRRWTEVRAVCVVV